MSAPGPAVGRGRLGWAAGLLTLVLLAGVGVLLAAPAAPATLPRSSASAFVPADATRGAVTLQVGAQRAAAELSDARLPGGAVRDAFSPTAYDALDPATRTDDGSVWLREDVVPAGGTLAARFRLRRVDARGVWLVAQDWDDLGLTLDGLLELPADVAAGRSWTSSGTARARPSDGGLRFTDRSAASVPDDPARAAEGCLAVVSSRTLTGTGPAAGAPQTWAESSLWCPGKGVVAGSGTWRGTTYAVTTGGSPGPVGDADVAPAPWDPAGVGSWRLRTVPVLVGDPTSGLVAGAVGADPATGQTPVVAASGVVVVPTLEGGDLAALVPRGGDLWAHGWSRPGGQTTSLAAVGSLVVAATTAHRVTAYRAGGTLVWSAPLPDVAVVPPLPVGDAVAVATVSGTLSLLDARTGTVRWTTAVGAGVHAALAAGDGVVLTADAGGNVTAWDLADGRQRWQVAGAASPFATTLLVAGGQALVVANGSVSAYAVTDGRRTWTRAVGLGLGTVAVAGDQLRVDDGGDLASWSATDGTTRWSLPATQAVPTAPGCDPPGSAGLSLARQGGRLIALDATGTPRGTWASTVSDDDVLTATCRGAGIDLTATSPAGSAPLVVLRLAAP